MKRTIICILGSSKFKDRILGHKQRLSLQGKIVLDAGFFHHVDKLPITDEDKRRLDELVLDKVEMADEVYVVDEKGYIGQTTRKAIEHALRLKKPITFEEHPVGIDDLITQMAGEEPPPSVG